MKNIIYVHGASSTPLTFNYIADKLPEHNRIDFTYDSNKDIEEAVEKLILSFILVGDKGPFDVIAHSLGGIVATGATYGYKEAKEKISKMAILSAPFAGSKAASYLKWLYPGYGLFNNVSVSNPLILQVQEVGAIVPTLNIITSGGDSPLIKEKNDGVVSVNSQLSLKNCKKALYELNHFEVLMSNLIVTEIEQFLWQK